MLIDRVDGLLFVRVTVCGALLVPVGCVAKNKLAGDKVAAGVTLRIVEAVCVTSGPVPVTVIAYGLGDVPTTVNTVRVADPPEEMFVESKLHDRTGQDTERVTGCADPLVV